jgi:simple sugar transport system ATP-binding protein
VPRPRLTPRAARDAGEAHIPEDRLARALVADLTVEENVALGRHTAPPFARGARIDFAGRRARTEALLELNDVRPRAPTLRAGGLSGGNQQKLVVGRELDQAPALLVVVQPTRGLDVAAVAAVRERLLAQRDQGCAVLLVSLDLDEVLALSDRLVVLYGGRVQATLARSAFEPRAIGALMLGGTA